MGWFHKFADVIEHAVSAVVEKAEDISQDTLNAWLDALLDAINRGDDGAARELLDKLAPLFSQAELATQVIGRAVISGSEERVARCVDFVAAQAWMTNAALVDLFFDAVAEDRPRSIILERLAARAWNLDDLLRALAGIPDHLTAALRLLVRIPFDGGPSTLHRRLLGYASAIDGMFEQIVAALLDLGLAWGRLFELVLGLDAEMKRTLRPLFRLFVAAGHATLDGLCGVIRHLDDVSAQLQRDFVAQWLDLFVANLPDPQDSLQILLDVAQRAFPGELQRSERVFVGIFEEFAEWARRVEERSSRVARAIAVWALRALDDVFEAPVSLADFGQAQALFGRIEGLGVMDAPVPFWLLGRGLTRIGCDALTAPAKIAGLIGDFVRAIRGLGDPHADRLLFALARLPGMLLILLPAMLRSAVDTPMKFMQWAGQDFRRLVQDDRLLKIKELPQPGGSTKYMLFSDIHRDAPEDVVEPGLFDVSHFRRNRNIYLKALHYCEEQGYTVVENGDCEELWYAPRLFGHSQHQRAIDILAEHKTVYEVLARLHHHGRYFRTRGNHDDYWDGPGRQLLADVFGDPTFEIWDALVIPEVKTMSDGLLDFPLTASAADKLQWMIDRIPLGLSPDRYTAKSPLLVLHGHQFDFWNCEEHAWLGHAITVGVAVPFDGIDAFPLSLRGIDLNGSPVVRFSDLLTSANFKKLTIWDNWPAEDVARRWTRDLEFSEGPGRHLSDSLSFSESLGVLMGWVMGFVRNLEDLPWPPEWPPKLPEGVQIALGHTHYPRSRPYLNLKWMPPLPDIVEEQLLNIRVPYFNTGNASWWEGIVWALEITAAGQPRLVYWDRETQTEPRVLAWELSAPGLNLGEGVRAQLASFLQTLVKTEPGMAGVAAKGGFSGGAPALGGINLTRLPTSFHLGEVGPDGQLNALLGALARMVVKLGWPATSDLTPFELVIDLDRLPTGRGPEAIVTPGLPPTFSLQRVLSPWLDLAGLRPGEPEQWLTVGQDMLRSMASTFFFGAFVFGGWLTQGLGMICYLASHMACDVQASWNRATHELRLKCTFAT
ncbi:MAG TPA: hypothetical protein VNO30_40605 [Kofleriaceae bacterium]|nr:hypothetical protein [Kofleriaceae bacterium]